MADYFVDRDVQYPGRVTITGEGDGFAQAIVLGEMLQITPASGGVDATITRNEGIVTEEGTPLNATNLNSGINQMIAAALKANVAMLTMSANSSKALTDVPAGSNFLVAWTTASGSFGIDYVWFSNESAVSRSLVLSGSQLITYSGSSQLTINNTAGSAVVRVAVISKVPTSV